MRLLSDNFRRRVDEWSRSRRSDAPNTGPGTGVFLERQLEQIMGNALEEQEPPRNWREAFPVDDRINEGASTFTHRIRKGVGKAMAISDYGDDLKTVNVTTQEFSRPVHDYGLAYELTVRDALSAQFAGEQLNDMLAAETRKGNLDTLNEVHWTGDRDNNVWGLQTHPYLLRFNYSNPIDYNTAVNTIINQISQHISTITEVTRTAVRPDTMGLAVKPYEVISTRRVPDTDITILQFIERTNPDIDNIMQWEELSGRGPAGGDIALVYRRRRSTIKATAPIVFRQEPPQERNLKVVVNTFSSTGGLYAPRPREVCIGEGV